MAKWDELWSALREARDGYSSVSAMADDIGVSDETLGRWLKKKRAGDAPREANFRAVAQWLEGRMAPQSTTEPEPTAADALELAGRAVEIEELMSYALHRQRLLRQAMQAAGLSLPAGPRSAAGSGGGR